jgi:hypothetical protein
MQRQCSGVTKAGERCKSWSLPGSDYCISHGDRVVQLAEWRKQGGRGKANRARAKREMVDAALTPAELNGLLGFTIKAVIAGKKPPGVGQAVAALARAALEAGKSADLEERMQEIERRLGAKVS